MKVKELMNLLEKEDPEKNIFLQKDSEGNGYSPLAGTGSWQSIPDHDVDWTFKDLCMEEEEEEWRQFKKDNPGGVVLFSIR